MPRIGATPFAFPDFRGATRRLILLNLAAYFALLLAQLALPQPAIPFTDLFCFIPRAFLHGWLWQPLTYSFIHLGILGTLFELLSLWFLAGFLENLHSSSWVTSLYAVSVLGAAAAATAIYAAGPTLGYSIAKVSLYGCYGGIFGLLVAIGALYGDLQFMLFPLPIGIKAKYLVAIYALVAIAMLFGPLGMYAFAQLGGALAGLLYIRLAPRRGVSFVFSERWYSLRNRYYRWKRRRAARKFEVYMRRQGRTVRFDGSGKQIDDDPGDKKRWN
ncbi:MAG TPA: rhomboid family intramembrane serine protease [Terracidiphilus sp.]|nr:rhomboid family intramembrane serine protease [Terracidiphilus sp.]